MVKKNGGSLRPYRTAVKTPTNGKGGGGRSTPKPQGVLSGRLLRRSTVKCLSRNGGRAHERQVNRASEILPPRQEDGRSGPTR